MNAVACVEFGAPTIHVIVVKKNEEDLMGRIGSEYGPRFLVMCMILGLYPHDCDHCNDRSKPLCTCGKKLQRGILEWCGEEE